MESATLDTRRLNLTAPMTHRPFRHAAVLGAGTMGAQIAAHLANAGLHVLLLDIAPEEGDRDAIVRKGFEQAVGARPDPFFSAEAKGRIELGNFEDDWERLSEVDWVIEAVVERIQIKRDVMERIEAVVGEETVVSSNTSGLPIREIVSDRSPEFRRRVLGTHFFNPPRYLKLLELVPTADTDRAVLERVGQFGRIHLGKGIVVANDVPYFIGNRVGVYGQLQAVRYFTERGYTIEEIDTLTGPLVGRPKSATFRTADVVGLDVLADVTRNLYEKLPDDERRDVFQVPELVERLVEAGQLGAKTRAGFYKKVDGEIRSVDPETLEYQPPAELELEGLEHVKQISDLDERVRALYEEEGRAGRFFRETTLDLLAYSARRIGEITESPADVDRAVSWGFGWEQGPFQLWDALGVERVRRDLEREEIEVPEWVDEMIEAGTTSFYQGAGTERSVYVPARKEYVSDPLPEDEVPLIHVGATDEEPIWTNGTARLVDLGDGVAGFVFGSKSNTLGREVMDGLNEAIDLVESRGDLRGIVIGNDGKNFAVGANLMEMGGAVQQGQFDQIEQMVARFQDTVQRVRYAEKPVVVATHQRVLGGACEMTMACPHPVLAAESYVGLVELGVGLIPAGTGTMRIAQQCAEGAIHQRPSEVQPRVQEAFERVAMAEVAESASQAVEMGYASGDAAIVMNVDRRLYVAKQRVIELSNRGYRPPAERPVYVLGEPTRAALEVALQQYVEGRFISEYDRYLASQLAYVLTGGDLSAPQEVPESYLLELEREVFMRLVGEQKTQARVEHMLKTGKPLRN